jgi:hypothetical protein
LVAYERQKELALGLAPGTLVPVGSSSSSLLAGPSSSSRTRGLTAAEDLYRGADTLAYGDSKPSEEAVDRVIGKINKEYVALLDGGFLLIIGVVWTRVREGRRTMKMRRLPISMIVIRYSIRRSVCQISPPVLLACIFVCSCETLGNNADGTCYRSLDTLINIPKSGSLLFCLLSNAKYLIQDPGELRERYGIVVR